MNGLSQQKLESGYFETGQGSTVIYDSKGIIREVKGSLHILGNCDDCF